MLEVNAADPCRRTAKEIQTPQLNVGMVLGVYGRREACEIVLLVFLFHRFSYGFSSGCFRDALYPTPDILELLINNMLKLVPYHTNSRHIIEYGLSTPELPLLIQGSDVLANFSVNILDKSEKLYFVLMF